METKTQKRINILKKQQQVAAILITIVMIIGITIVILSNNSSQQTPINYTYEIVKTYPHDPEAFTQGLEFNSGFLFESTGLFAQSSLRKVKLETGEVIKSKTLPDQYFGEGITIFDNKIIQLTWISNKGFVYNMDSFEVISEFSYPTQGWGITNDGSNLIMSDGSSTLYFLDPNTYEKIKEVTVIDQNPVSNLNELEFIQGQIYANIFQQHKIAIINPQSGKVEGWIDLSGINEETNQDPNKVLNGIAYDKETDRLFITGKKWSKLYHINLVKIN